MRILTVSDVEAKKYYDHYRAGVLKGIDLILSCGDLRRQYLEFLVTMAGCPLLYVRGNHDDGFVNEPPEGCTCIDGEVVRIGGLRIAGLGGCHKYRDGLNMYTEGEMARRYMRMLPSIVKSGGVDILLTHAPAYGLGDIDTIPHRGFRTFNRIMNRHKPAYMIHGHIHMTYGINVERVIEYKETTIINAYESYIIEIDD